MLNAQRLDYGDVDGVRVLLSIADVTDMRLAEKLRDDLIREKEILLREVQHRVANSLQIIASILMQSARQVQSEETRSHLTLAHGRVMSIAAVQPRSCRGAQRCPVCACLEIERSGYNPRRYSRNDDAGEQS